MNLKSRVLCHWVILLKTKDRRSVLIQCLRFSSHKMWTEILKPISGTYLSQHILTHIWMFAWNLVVAKCHSWYVNALSNILNSSSIKSSHITQFFFLSSSFPFSILCSIQFTICCIAFSIGSSSWRNEQYIQHHTNKTTKMCLSARHLLLSCGCDGIFGDA